MDNSVRMRIRERLTGLDENLQQSLEWVFGNGEFVFVLQPFCNVVQIVARDSLHREIEAVVVIETDVVNRDCVGMLKLSRDTSLTKKPPPMFLLLREFRQQRFHRHRPTHD